MISQTVSTVSYLMRCTVSGVLAQESFKGDPAATYIPAPYIKWLESAGARVVPVLLFRSDHKQLTSLTFGITSTDSLT